MSRLFSNLNEFEEDSQEFEKSAGQRNRERNAARSRSASAETREIGPLPQIHDRERRRRCLASLELFLTTYFPQSFQLAFSEIHRRGISKIEETVAEGGLYAFAMPRGSGKTTITEGSAIWAALKGVRKFIQLIGASADKAKEILASIKTEIETNDLLLEDFPELCYPIVMLEGISNRANGQTLDGERTRIEWTKNKLVLPTVPNSPCSGTVIRASGITGAIRGAKHKTADGEVMRPDYVIVDDPQTMQSAASESQNEKRFRIIAQDVLGLPGPGKKIAGVMPCTVIFPGDMVDRTLDRKQNPRWCGERSRMLESWPDNIELWEEYGRIREEGFRAEDGGEAAREFYRQHRKAMDKGAAVSWPERYNEDELSAIQHAMNLYLDDHEAFHAEYQNEPQSPRADIEQLTAEEIASRTNGLPRLVCPNSAKRITAAIDVQGKLLFYCMIAWSDNFTGAVIDYGSWPEQGRQYYTLREASRSLGRVYRERHLETLIHSGLTDLVEKLFFGRPYLREDGSPCPISLIGVDANWETQAVKSWCLRHGRGGLIMPLHGRYVGAASKPFADYRKEAGVLTGQDWRSPKAEAGKPRHILFDSNAWKTFERKRLAAPAVGAGALTLWGDDARTHRIFADHHLAEVPTRTHGRDREVDEWRLKPNKPDNHLLDCASMCHVLESVCGGTLDLIEMNARKKSRGGRKRRQARKKIAPLKC